MSYETAIFLSKALRIGQRLDVALWLGTILVWLTGFYILFQMYRLRFLKILILAELLTLAHWVWLQRFVLFGSLAAAPLSNIDRSVAYQWIDFALRFLQSLAYLTGGILAVRYLQQKWKQQIDAANKTQDGIAEELGKPSE